MTDIRYKQKKGVASIVLSLHVKTRVDPVSNDG